MMQMLSTIKFCYTRELIKTKLYISRVIIVTMEITVTINAIFLIHFQFCFLQNWLFSRIPSLQYAIKLKIFKAFSLKKHVFHSIVKNHFYASEIEKERREYCSFWIVLYSMLVYGKTRKNFCSIVISTTEKKWWKF